MQSYINKIEKVELRTFVSNLFEAHKKISDWKINKTELLHYGHFRGWLEDSDERNPEGPLNRQTAARIIHMFMLIELGIPDLQDITPAYALKDLYTCRVCTNHLAQVYTRGIMKAEKKEEPDFSDSPALFFNHLALVSKTEAQKIMGKVF